MGATEAKIARVEAILGYAFKDQALVRSAITHPSASEGRPISDCYERLEFLGDSVLGAIVALDMYERFPEMNEGELTRLKVSLVSGETLSMVGSELGLGECIIFGESEKGSGARGMRSALENVYESLVGAMYLDGGMAVAHEFVIRTLQPHMSRERAMRPENPKSRLQEITQRDMRIAPEYKLVNREGPAHAPTFTSVVMVDGRRIGRGSGSSKKEAESEAARDAINRMGLEETERQ